MIEDQSTVLLVEDEPLIRLFISDLLEDAGFKVVEAANSMEALTILEAGLPVDVFLTDVDIPFGCNGFDLAWQVHGRWQETEILIMSGRQWPSRGDLPPGAAFLAKPCPNDAIVSHVISAAERTKRIRNHGGKSNVSKELATNVVPFPKTG
ncbi:response regulator [Microvirga puerhi]|uniref:Response regulator n=1 Tax=Microvirga puerhi TaxID=2876078 RepID=A0ABS7VN49_9HYPH|nr:response regulator [Microvirga puerhi]MBZ6076530.1 response regulator [Microvirga puerhi]